MLRSVRALVQKVLATPATREAFWLSSGQAAAIAARLIEVRLVTTLAPPEVYGEVVLLMGLATLGAGSFCIPLNTALARFFPDAKVSARIAALREVVGGELLRRTLAMAALLVAIGLAWNAAGEQGPGPWGFLLVSLLLCMDSWRLFESDLLNADRRQAICALWAAVNAWGRMLLAVAALLWVGRESTVLLFAYTVAVLMGNLLFRRLRVREEPGATRADALWRRRTLRAARRFAAPLVPVAGLQWVLTLSDRYALAWLHGTPEAGIYAAAYGLASLPFITWGGVLTQILRPIYFASVTAGDATRQHRVLWAWMGLLAVPAGTGLLIIALFSLPLARVLLGEVYWSAAEVMPWIAGAYAVQSLRHLFDCVILARRNNARLLAVHAVGAMVAVVGFLTLIPTLGALGAALGSLAGMSASLFASIALSGVLPELLLRRLR